MGALEQPRGRGGRIQDKHGILGRLMCLASVGDWLPHDLTSLDVSLLT